MRHHLRATSLPLSLLLTLALTAAACGGSDDGDEGEAVGTAGTDRPTVVEVTTDAAPTTGAPVSSAPATTEAGPATTAPMSDASSTLPEPAPWDGPRFDEAVEEVLADLALVVGQPLDPATAFPGVVIPVPGPADVIGAGFRAEVDPFDDSIGQTFALGLDLAIDPTGLETWAQGPIDGWTAPSFASSGSLYTSLLIDGVGQRLVYVLDTDAAASGRPPVNAEWEPAATEMPDPPFLASLPRPDGGVLTELNVAVGTVSSGFVSGGAGRVVVRFDYEPTALDELIAFFEDGVLLGAGFEYEPSPLSMVAYRRDVTIGDWSGSVSISELTVDDQVASMQVLWDLTRS